MKKVLLVLGFISFILVGCSYEVDNLLILKVHCYERTIG